MQTTDKGGKCMHKFDYSFLKNMMVPANFLNLTNTIYSLRSEEDVIKKTYPDIFTGLQKIAIVQSVKGSNAIEGIVATDKRIEEIVNQNANPLNHNEKEILGYKDALNIVHTQYTELSLEEKTILNLHQTLLGHSEYPNRGLYKKQDNVIRERYADGTSFVRWMPTSAKDTKFAMEQLILAYMDARCDSSINELLLIPCVILDFLCIHPFDDGNGRMSRLLSLLLLYKNNFDVSKYISFEEQINKTRSYYYEALKRSSEGWHENKNDYLPFMENFLTTLYFCYYELDKRFLTIKSGKVSKTKRIEEVVLNSFIPVSKRDIVALLPDVSITTIEKVLSTMLKEEKIKKIGSTNNCKYHRNK